MADIVIFDIVITGHEQGDRVAYSGHARCSTMKQDDLDILWNAVADVNATAEVVSAAMLEAATYAAEQRGFTVGPLDKKIVTGGASTQL